ncbi:hypothetical protein HY989_04175 [Candidatus Micrarchaeota archaeon]|nr:hypothetical protein [Candidatus Micrarchaeota archaeon]
MGKIKIFVLIVCVIYFNLPNASAFVYDDFSASELNTTKWNVSAGVDGFGPISDFYLDAINKNYHTKQTVAADGRVRVKLSNYIFGNGEALDYDVFLNSGSGNYMSRIVINDVPLDVAGLCLYCGAIGYWGQPMAEGDAIGKYHIRLNFNQSNTTIKITRPDNTFTFYQSTNFNAPFIFAFETTTGHDGITHVDYDNFAINQECGDVNGDGKINVVDLTYLVAYLFSGGPEPKINKLIGDVNGDGKVNVVDITYLVNYLFKAGPAPTTCGGLTTPAATVLSAQLTTSTPKNQLQISTD